MTVSLTIEASQPSGETYRMALSCKMHIALWLAVLTRLL